MALGLSIIESKQRKNNVIELQNKDMYSGESYFVFRLIDRGDRNFSNRLNYWEHILILKELLDAPLHHA